MPKHPTPAERDERVVLPLDPDDALRWLLAVKPDPVQPKVKKPKAKKTPPP